MPKAQYTEDTRRQAAAVLELRRRKEAAELATKAWQPRSVPQTKALESKASELLYGGAAGGGKSDLLLGCATTRNYKSLILRRQYPLLRDLVERSKEILDNYPNARYNEQQHIWRGIPGDRTLEFGSCVHEDDKNKYRGRPHGLKGFDELPQFSEHQYRFIIGWTRSTNPKERPRVISTGNPPMTREEAWVIKYWGPWLDADYKGKPAIPGELRWFVTVGGKDLEVDEDYRATVNGILVKPRSRTFLPARLQDNPILLEMGYGDVLNSLAEPLRSLLLFGDYANVAAMQDDPWQVIPTAWVEAAQERWKKGGPNGGLGAVAVDVATAGDRFVIGLAYGSYYELHTCPGSETPDGITGARKVVEAMGLNPHGINLHTYRDSYAAKVPIHVDIVGPGSSVADTLRFNGLEVYGVHGSAATSAMDSTEYMAMANLRAEMHWKLREALDPVYGDGLMIPDDPELKEELTAARWMWTRSGVQIEDKRDIIQRIGRSPDLADALMMLNLDMRGRSEVSLPNSTSARAYGPNTAVDIPRNVQIERRGQAPSNAAIRRAEEHAERYLNDLRSHSAEAGAPRPVRGPNGEVRYEW